MRTRSPVFKERKREGQTDEQSVSLRGLVCLVGASLGGCPGASVAWRRGARLRSDRWRWALSESLPVSRIDCRDLSQASCSLLNLPYKRKPHVMLWIFRTVFFFPLVVVLDRGGWSETMCPGSVYPPEVSCQWRRGLNAGRFQHGYCAYCSVVYFLLPLLFYSAPLAVSVPWQEKTTARDQTERCCEVLGECKQTAERSRDWVRAQCKEMFRFSSIDSLRGIMSITVEGILSLSLRVSFF